MLNIKAVPLIATKHDLNLYYLKGEKEKESTIILKRLQILVDKMMQQNIKKAQKRAWDSESDRMLVELIADIGPRQWEVIANAIPDRSGKQCRERWNNQLNPLLKKTTWSLEEGWILFIL